MVSMSDPRVQPTTEPTRPRRGSRVTLSSLVLLTLGCAPDPEPADDGVVQTEHLRITTTTGNPICAGTPLWLESELLRISNALELPLWGEDDKLDVRFGEDAVQEVCANIELDHLNGCFHYGSTENIVAGVGLAGTAPHELVHAVRYRNLRPAPAMVEEGLAQILSGSDGFPLYVEYPHGDPFVGPLELLEIPRADFDLGNYIDAQSFLSWLWETQGRSTLMAFANDPALANADTALSLFEHHVDLSLADAEQAWRDDDRPDPIWGAPCIPERTYSLADGPVEISADLDCDDPTTLGAAYSMYVMPMCLDVPETTRIRLSLDANHGRLEVLWREPCDPGPASAEAGQSKYVEAGQTVEADIVGCRFRMLLKSRELGFPATPYTIRIEEIVN